MLRKQWVYTNITEVKKNLNKKYKVEEVEKYNPTLKIVGVEEELNNDELVQCIVNQKSMII